MGECAYYFKAACLKDVQEVKEYLDEFFKEAREFYPLIDDSKSIDWDECATRFPKLTEYLKEIDLFGKKDHNAFAGQVDFGQDENNETLVKEDLLWQTVCWGDGNVWHFANWQPLCDFVQKKFPQVMRAIWGSEDDGIGCLESLKFFDWEEIVFSILKNKEALPLFIGSHKDLDRLIDLALSKE